MSKVLILGICPLPIENEKMLNAPGIRTWQFTKSLLKDGHKICLVCSRTPGAYDKVKLKKIKKKTIGERLIYYSLTQEKFLDSLYLEKICNEFQPNCIVSASSFLPSFLAVQLRIDIPIWIDQSGDLMSEAQMRAFVEKDNSYIYEFWRIEREILERGDIFSSISSSQRYSLIGKLGAKGRLNKETVGYEFAYVIPNGIDGYKEKKDCSANNSIIRGKYVKKDDFVILWSGSYNTWTNVDVLFSALEKAMDKNKKIKFVSTGGAVPTHNEVTYSHFLDLVNNSRFKNRFIMLGWVPAKDLSKVYLESNLGINIDRPCYEAQLGSRNRILAWMAAGLPGLSTNFCELTQILEEKKLGFTFSSENSDALSKLMLKLSSQKKLLSQYARRAKNFVQKEFTYEKTTKPLRVWVKNPKHSPDKINKSKTKKYLENVKKDMRSIETQYIDNLKEKEKGLKNQINDLSKELNNKTKELDNRAGAISIRDNKLYQLELEVNNLRSEQDNIKNYAKAKEKELSGLRIQTLDLSKQIKILIAQVDDLQSKLSKIYATKAYKLYKLIKKFQLQI